MHFKFKFFIIALLQLVAMTAAADTWTYTFKQGDLSSSTVTLNNVSWAFSETGSTVLDWDGNSSKGIQIGSKKNPATAASLTTSGISGTITKVTVNASIAKSGTAKLSVSVGGKAWLSDQALTTTAKEYSAEGSASGEIVISFSNTAKAFYIKSITVEYSAGPAVPAAPTFSPDGKTTLTGATEVTISSKDATSITYTTDGTDPSDTNGTKVDGDKTTYTVTKWPKGDCPWRADAAT